jgi:hypothetical protein
MMALILLPSAQAETEAATQQAWAIVADAYETAAQMHGVSQEQHDMFVRCARKANSLAGRSPFAVVRGEA